jgi:hypothetical protein
LAISNPIPLAPPVIKTCLFVNRAEDCIMED